MLAVAVAKENGPPIPMMVLDEICMTRCLNLIHQAAVREDGVVKARLERPIGVPGSRYGDAVSFRCPSLGDRHVIPVSNVVEMRCLRIGTTGAWPEKFCLRKLLAGFDIDLALIDTTHGSPCGTVTRKIDFAVVKQERRINSFLRQPDRLGPFSGGVFRPDKKVPPTGHIGRDHVEPSLVIADRRCIDPV